MVEYEAKVYHKTEESIDGIQVEIISTSGENIETIQVTNKTQFDELIETLEGLTADFVPFQDGSSLSGRTIDNLLANSSENVTINATKLGGYQSDSYSKTGHTHDDRYFTEAEVTSKLAQKSDTSHAHNTWTSQALTSYGTLYVNSALKLCELHYKRTFVSAQANQLYNWHTGVIPSAYRPKHLVTGVANRNGGVLCADISGNLYGRFTEAFDNSPEIQFHLMWHY